ncbi:dual specificity protein phosphatase 1-like [Gigantopelta aegis]|uniref:dual specificity protein phosphatase 1-like n=1 Tax=Gigantopelta aegis TaxID=1735272 RepID=UPI001B88A05A|nr:dual specificity protein phosphatase 1-like [Gigantopelta aegis]
MNELIVRILIVEYFLVNRCGRWIILLLSQLFAMATAISISPHRVKQLLEDHFVLYIDTRSFMQYNNERILSAVNIYCPPLLRKRHPSCVPLENILSDEIKQILRRDNQTVILYDEDSDEFSMDNQKSDLNLIHRSLIRFLGNRSFFFISGGYRRFKEEYPQLCFKHSTMFTKLNLVLKTQRSFPETPDGQYSGPDSSLNRKRPVELLPYLYIGDSSHSSRKDVLKNIGVTAILNVSTSCENHFPQDFRYKVIPVEDTVSEDLRTWFTEAIDFIEDERRSGGVILVHCSGGVSRSATVCLAYLMYSRSQSLEDAFEYIKCRREVISPNTSFMIQLSLFEKELISYKTSKTVSKPTLSPCRLYSHGFMTPSDNNSGFSFHGCDVTSASPEVEISHVTSSFTFLSSPVVSTN